MSVTSNMLLTLPDLTPIPTSGPTFATEFTAAYQQIDSHNHTTYRGTPVPSAGLGINADLPFLSNASNYNAVNVRSARLISVSSPLGLTDDLNCVYVVSGDWYFNDGAGHQIQLTSGTSLNTAGIGTIGGDYSGSTASVYYTSASSLFYFTSNTLIAAKMNHGAVTIFDTPVNAHGVTLLAAHVLAADYTLKFMTALPASTKIMTLTSGGLLTSAYDVDNVTLGVTSNLIGVIAGSISGAYLASACVTTPKMAAVNIASGSASGAWTNATTTYSTICTVTITTNGRTVRVLAQPASASDSYFGVNGNLAATMTMQVQLLLDGVSVAIMRVADTPRAAAGKADSGCAGVDFDFFDTSPPSAGSHTYTLQGRAPAGSITAVANNIMLVAVEQDY